MVSTRNMRHQRSAARALEKRVHREEHADRTWTQTAPAKRCCPTGDHAAERGCMACVLQLERIAAAAAADTNGHLSPISLNACMLAAREGRRDVLAYILPKFVTTSAAGAVLVRDLIYFAAVPGHLATMAYLHGFFVSTFSHQQQQRRTTAAAKATPPPTADAWCIDPLCHMLAMEGQVDCLLFALEHGATWPNRADTAGRLSIYAPDSTQAECCRIAASSRFAVVT